MRRTFGFVFILIVSMVLALSPTTARAELLSDSDQQQSVDHGRRSHVQRLFVCRHGQYAQSEQCERLWLSTNAAGDAGLLFQGAFLDFPGTGGSDAFVDFHVGVNNGVSKITVAATLAGNPVVLGTGPGIISITETFLPENANAIMSVYDVTPGSTLLSNTVNFNPGYTSLDVQKDILAFSGSASSVPTLSFFTQTFHVVPEPASASLLGLGAFGLMVALAAPQYCSSSRCGGGTGALLTTPESPR